MILTHIDCSECFALTAEERKWFGVSWLMHGEQVQGTREDEYYTSCIILSTEAFNQEIKCNALRNNAVTQVRSTVHVRERIGL